MSGIGGIVSTALSFYVASSIQKTAFGATALMSLFVAFFQAWKKEHLAADKREVTFEIGDQSFVRHVFPESRKTMKSHYAYPPGIQKTKATSTPHYVELLLSMRFVNRAIHPMLIRKVEATLLQRKRFGITKPVDESLGFVPTKTLELGLTVPGQSLSDYHLLKWSVKLPSDFMDLFLSECFVRIDMYTINKQPLRMDCGIGNRWDGLGRLTAKREWS